MIWQIVHKVEVKIAQKVGVILQDQQHDADGANVECLHRLRKWLCWQHILLEEPESADNQVLDLIPGLILLLVRASDKVRHEQSVRDQLEPREGKGRVLKGRKFFEDFRHVKQNLPLRLGVEAVADIDSGQDVDQQSVVGLLVEAAQSLGVVFLQLGFDVDQDLVHKLSLVELECF